MNNEARLFLVMMAIFTFAMGLSNLFLNIFIWKIDGSFTTLAIYSLVYSVVVLGSFPLCSMYARKYSPMASLRIGILFFLMTFATVLFYKEKAAQHIYEIGFWMGMGASFFAIGMHMQTLDSTKDQGRDKFLYLGNFLNSISGMLAPLVAGTLIETYDGMRGFYYVFSITVIFYLVAAVISIRLKGNSVSRQSQFRQVWRNPTKQWRGMYWITMGGGMVEGTYSTFLVTMMSYFILKSELSLGGFSTFAALVGLITSIVLSKVAKPNRRIMIYGIGATLVAVASIWISFQPAFFVLVIYTVVATVGMNMISTTLNVFTYAAIEKDPDYANRRLDYIVIREIPLGVGRMFGILLFLIVQATVGAERILSVTFAGFGIVFLIMIPALQKIWTEKRDQAISSTIMKSS